VAERSCQQTGAAPPIVWLLPWLALAGVCLAVILSARAVLRRRAGSPPVPEPGGFLAVAALGSSLLFAVAITAQVVAPAVLHGCG
jgi:hypothetical protein